MRKQFAEKFADIQREFDRTFKELFGGGKGSLELTGEEDTNDILECGIKMNLRSRRKETSEYDAAVRWRKGTDSDCIVICNPELKAISVLSVR